MVEDEDIVIFDFTTVSDEHLDIIRHNAKLSCADLPSHIHDPVEREKRRSREQITGQLGNYAASMFLTGSAAGYFEARKIANANPLASDGGVDIIGLENVDIKTSMMNADSYKSPREYNLAVRPPDNLRKNWVYIQALIAEKEPWKVLLMGGLQSHELPRFPHQGGTFDGAYLKPIWKLHTLKEIDKHIIRT